MFVADQSPDYAITKVLQAVQGGDPRATDELLTQVYDELRRLARSRLAKEANAGAGMTLQATALVHEAYLRLVSPPAEDPEKRPANWQNRGHFFGAAALAMRRIMVERARHEGRAKHGSGRKRVPMENEIAAADQPDFDAVDLISLDEALGKLEQLDPRKAKIVTLRYFAGLSIEETAAGIDLSPATVKNEWAFARAWLHREMTGGGKA
jgi:RNA polymerase sigma factor (TIGR02999 family)